MNAAAHYAAIFAGPQPTIESARLLIRPFVDSDGPAIERFAGDIDVARTLLAMPHPYPEGAAVKWIALHEAAWNEGRELPLAMIERASTEFLGAIALRFETLHHHAEVGYWLRRDRWGMGIVSEATAAINGWAFHTMGLNRVFARHMHANPASGAVMRKNGMRHEGTLRQHYEKNGAMHDFHIYGILREEFFAQEAAAQEPERA